ncbi:MAG: DUF5110 domain-containing protein, partial [Bacteroidaceae bacterium]|nr:DUF5110 domain-containing protein [Bacteroidaceae bacterium]
YSTIALHWNDKKGELRIAQRQGQFPGMLEKRTFRLRVAGREQVKSITYDGTEQVIKL